MCCEFFVVAKRSHFDFDDCHITTFVTYCINDLAIGIAVTLDLRRSLVLTLCQLHWLHQPSEHTVVASTIVDYRLNAVPLTCYRLE